MIDMEYLNGFIQLINISFKLDFGYNYFEYKKLNIYVYIKYFTNVVFRM